MKRGILTTTALVLALLLASCGDPSAQHTTSASEVTTREAATAMQTQTDSPFETTAPSVSENASREENTMMQMKIADTAVTVQWEENAAVSELKELTVQTPLTVRMSMYGGFEQVGSIGKSLPREDAQTTANAGDIVLYAGNQLVVFYGTNAWAYTRLGHITDKTEEDLTKLLGNGDVTITIESFTVL